MIRILKLCTWNVICILLYIISYLIFKKLSMTNDLIWSIILMVEIYVSKVIVRGRDNV